jgi:hypothetical protein
MQTIANMLYDAAFKYLMIYAIMFIFINIQSRAQNNLQVVESLKKLEGEFYAVPHDDSVMLNNNYKHAMMMFKRKTDGLENRLLDSLYHTFEIKHVKKRKVAVKFISENTLVYQKVFKIKQLKDGSFRLKNKNLIISGIPLLFLSVDFKSITIKPDTQGLVIEEKSAYYAHFLCFGTARETTFINKYKRIIK